MHCTSPVNGPSLTPAPACTSTFVDEAVAVVRARQLGCELPPRLRVAVVTLEPDGDDQRLDALATTAERIAAAAGVNVLAGRRGATLALVLGVEDTTVTRSVVGQVMRALRGAVGAAGVSACVDWSADLRDAHRQARQAIEAAAFAPEGPALCSMSSACCVSCSRPATAPPAALRRRRARPGARLRPRSPDAPRRHARHLARQGGSLTRTAAGLYVHPKTVRYRLRRVEELTHRDLSEQRDRFDAQLAIAILRALALDNGASDQDESLRFS